MKRVLQHSKTGLYLGIDGRLTADPTRAWICPTLGDAMVVCSQCRYLATEFVYRIIEPNPLWFQSDLMRQYANSQGLRA